MSNIWRSSVIAISPFLNTSKIYPVNILPCLFYLYITLRFLESSSFYSFGRDILQYSPWLSFIRHYSHVIRDAYYFSYFIIFDMVYSCHSTESSPVIICKAYWILSMIHNAFTVYHQ